MSQSKFQWFSGFAREYWYEHYGRENDGIKTYVYFLSDGEFTKIGVAADVRKRTSELQIGNARKLRLIEYIPWNCTQLAKSAEKQLHALFRDSQISGEWFDLRNDKWACDFIRSITHYYEHDYATEGLA